MAGRIPISASMHATRATPQRSAVDLTQAALRGLRAVEPKLQSFLAHDEELALKQAAEVDARIAAGEHLPLAGMTIGVKVRRHLPCCRHRLSPAVLPAATLSGVTAFFCANFAAPT